MLKAIWAFVSFSVLIYLAIDMYRASTKKKKLSALKQISIASGCSLLAVVSLFLIVVAF